MAGEKLRDFKGVDVAGDLSPTPNYKQTLNTAKTHVTFTRNSQPADYQICSLSKLFVGQLQTSHNFLLCLIC